MFDDSEALALLFVTPNQFSPFHPEGTFWNTGVSRGNRTLISAATERSFTIKLWTPRIFAAPPHNDVPKNGNYDKAK